MLLALAISLLLVAPDAEQAVEHAATASLAAPYPAAAHRLDVEVRRLGGDVTDGADLDELRQGMTGIFAMDRRLTPVGLRVWRTLRDAVLLRIWL